MTTDEARKQFRKIAEDMQSAAVEHYLMAAYQQGRQDAARECAEICDTAEVLIPIEEWKTRRKVSAATAEGLGKLIREKFGLEVA